MKVPEQVLTTDVLVIGAGLAGCFAAIRAKELGADVVMVDQRKSGFCGESAIGMHMYRFLHPNDDFEAAVEGTVIDTEYMVDQDCLRAVLRDSWSRFQDMLKYGVQFRKDDLGQIEIRVYETETPIFQYRYAAFEPMAKYYHMLRMTKEAVRRGVRILDRIMVVDLIHSNGKINGAFGFNIVDGTFYVFNAKAIVLANGNLTLNTMGSPSHTGDGMVMALRAGAELRNMEFTGTAIAPIGPPTFMQRGFRPEPEYLITNALGEEYLQKYEETKRLTGRRYAGPPWRRQTRVTLHEWMEGRGPTYVEFVKPQGTTYSSLIREYWGSGFDRQLKWFEDRGYTALGKLQYDLVLRFGEGAGGIGINSDCETTVPGLFAGGSVSGPWGWGATGYTISGGGLTNAAVMGYRAGESAAKHALAQNRSSRISSESISQLRESTYVFLERKGIVPDELRLKIAKAWVNLDVRDEARLEKAQVELQTLEKEAADLSADDYHELEKCHKIKSLILCAQAIASAARVRKETRLLHIRLDYPLRNNKDWLKWTITHLDRDNVRTDVRNLPIERWKYKPEPTLVDPLRPATKEA